MRKQRKHKRRGGFVYVPIGMAILVVLLWTGVGRDFTNSAYAAVSMMFQSGEPGFAQSYEENDASNLPQKGEIAEDSIDYPGLNAKFAKLICKEIGLRTWVYYGDTDEVLEKGAGLYTGSSIFGQGRTILVSAHDSTYFAPLEKIKSGAKITALTDYGKFIYQVTETKVVKETETEATKLDGKEEQLVLYTCYPFQSQQKREQRFFVYAKKISGPTLKEVAR